ncbi:class I SAM-dependent methyltransferase [Umezawaea sp. Da 62-37]|uniref:class I SAM-dependent methyltransferase n=1 Tax=Umezawaea sp. Da 62-37 TaxID=3075927 RepID=UPI0028F7266F|nr:class I SAM-dependent methyltransferase [Umezawaea sp. Da 62-37]WNV91586.1 class I SAM-dependent methyltransferase [Umezawaea sp. Da 62-37]
MGSKRRADYYDGPAHDYVSYWDGRDYEHAAEEVAIRKLLGDNMFERAADIGGGYGRLSLLLRRYAEHVTLAEPSKRQLDVAADFLAEHPEIERVRTQADDLVFADGSLDLVTMIRVSHHLPTPGVEFAEISRVLAVGGTAIVEVANVAHARNRLRYLLRREPLPTAPVDIRSPENRHDGEIPFVNHNPHVVIEQLAAVGLRTEKVLSVSNLRNRTLKRLLPHRTLVGVERFLQPVLAPVFFGPSIFLLLRKE